MNWKSILRVWGWLCLIFAAFYIALGIYAVVNPNNIFTPGPTGLGTWIGMGLISHGLAEILDRLDKK